MGEIEDIRPRQIIRTLSEIDPWDNEGCCRICEGVLEIVDVDSGTQRYQMGRHHPGTHTAVCPWERARMWAEDFDRVAANGGGDVSSG